MDSDWGEVSSRACEPSNRRPCFAGCSRQQRVVACARQSLALLTLPSFFVCESIVSMLTMVPFNRSIGSCCHPLPMVCPRLWPAWPLIRAKSCYGPATIMYAPFCLMCLQAIASLIGIIGPSLFFHGRGAHKIHILPCPSLD